MDTGIGATLREARNRRKIDLSQVEAATKIRARFLRAMENEEWGVLPGETYARGFLRTYASYLGLDGERLAEEYRQRTAAEGAERSPRVEPVPTALGPRAPRVPGWVWVALVSAFLIVVAIGIGLAGGGGGEDSPAPGPAGRAEAVQSEREVTEAVVARPGVSIRLQATGEVWVCLLNGREEPLIDGQILAAGSREGPFRSGSFTISFGNGEVIMRVDGREAEIPVTSSPIGYEVGNDGELIELEEAERPTCA